MIQSYHRSISSLRGKITIIFIIYVFIITFVTAIGIWINSKEQQIHDIEEQLENIQVNLSQVIIYEHHLYSNPQQLSTPDKDNLQTSLINYQILLKQLGKDLEDVAIASQRNNLSIHTLADSLSFALKEYERSVQEIVELKNRNELQNNRFAAHNGHNLSEENIRNSKVNLVQHENKRESLLAVTTIPLNKLNRLDERQEKLSVNLHQPREVLNAIFSALLTRWSSKMHETNHHSQLIFVGLGLVALIGSIVIYLFLVKAIIIPINSLNTNINKLAESGFEKQSAIVDLYNNDELKCLINNINLLIHYQRSKVEEMTGKANLLAVQNQTLQSYNHKLAFSEQELIKLHTVKDKFFSILSHDLKGPLHTLTGFLGILKVYAESFTVKELQDFAQEMDKAVGQLLELLSNLLKWSLAQTGNLNYKPIVLSFNDVVTSNIALLSETAKLKSVTLSYQENNYGQLHADKDMVDFILRNLLTNAIKFSNENGSVQVKNEKLDNMLAITICDNGTGMSEEEIKKLFQPQHHFSTPGTAKEKGTGFGLLLCKEFVSLHGGSISINSKLNEGTCITFTLPYLDMHTVNYSMYEVKKNICGEHL